MQSSRSSFYSNFMGIAMCFQGVISLSAAIDNGIARLNGLDDERAQTHRRGVRNLEHANSSNGFPILFRSNGNQCFFKGLSLSNAFLKSSQSRFIELNTGSQSIQSESNHGSRDFMKPSTCPFILSKPKNMFETKGACAVFMGKNPPNCCETDKPRLLCIFKNVFSYYRNLTVTRCTPIKHSSKKIKFNFFRMSYTRILLGSATEPDIPDIPLPR